MYTAGGAAEAAAAALSGGAALPAEAAEAWQELQYTHAEWYNWTGDQVQVDTGTGAAEFWNDVENGSQYTGSATPITPSVLQERLEKDFDPKEESPEQYYDRINMYMEYARLLDPPVTIDATALSRRMARAEYVGMVHGLEPAE